MGTGCARGAPVRARKPRFDVLWHDGGMQVHFVAPDFNTRQKAPPPCPGHSPTGGCGVMGMAELSNFSHGAMPWFEHQLRMLGHMSASARATTVMLLTHQPFRCRPGVPDWYFCFSKTDKALVQDVIRSSGIPVTRFFGQLAGHQHRWFNGTAFDDPDFASFRQFETSAVKGDGTYRKCACVARAVYAPMAIAATWVCAVIFCAARLSIAIAHPC